MEVITDPAVRQNLAKTMEKVCKDHSPVIVKGLQRLRRSYTYSATSLPLLDQKYNFVFDAKRLFGNTFFISSILL
jgi:hypothetical protein